MLLVIYILVMKILFISTGHPVSDNYPNGGGTQSQIYGMGEELANRGHDVYVLKRYTGKKTEDSDINFIDVKTSFSDDVISVLLFSKNTISKINEIQPDVINLLERFSAHFPSKLEIPKVFFTSNYDAFAFYRKFAVNYNRLNYFFFDIKKMIEEGVMKRSDVVIALNKSTENYLHSRGIMHTRIVPRGVYPELYHNSGDGKYVLYAGRLNKVKGIEHLIKAYDALDRDYDAYDLFIVGSGPDEMRLKKLALASRKKEKIKFIPWVDKSKLKDYLSKCSVFVLPSLFETFGIVILEAMASHKTVIASNITGPRDIITDRKDGLLFEKENVKSLKEKLELCLSDEALRNRLGKEARKTVEANYTFENICEKLIKIYEEIT